MSIRSRADKRDKTDTTSLPRGSVGSVPIVDADRNGANASWAIPRRQFVALVAYLETGSHHAGAHRLGISESTSRQRVSDVIRALGVHNAMQAVWVLRAELERERGMRLAAGRSRGSCRRPSAPAR